MAARNLRAALLGTAAVAIAAGAAAALRPVEVLEIEHARGRVRLALAPGEPFAVVSHHSMFDAPVVEEFALDERGRIALRAVSSPSAAALEYLGISAGGERHPVERVMPEVVFRVAAGTAQRLVAGGAERSFLEFGDHGDRLVLRAGRAPSAAVRAAGAGCPERARP